MREAGGAPRPGAKALQEASEWFARLRGPEGERLRPTFERWRDADPRNAAAFAEVEALWGKSAGLAGTQTGRNRQLPRKRPSLFAIPMVRPALAGIALIAAAGLGFAMLHRPTTNAPTLAENGPQIATGIGEIRTLRLADGSSVTLDTDSAIDVRIGKAGRAVRLLRGRARFDVVPDAARPFQVEAGGRTVTALATLFDVDFAPEGVRVNLLRGVVDVTSSAREGKAGRVTRLAVGDCLSDLGEGPRIAPSPRGAEQWVTGMLSFDKVPLREVLEQTNRYSAVKIRLGSDGLASLRVTGAFRPLPVEALAASLAAALSLRITHAPDGSILLRKD